MGKRRSDDLNTSSIALVGVVGAIVVFAIIVALQVWFYNLYEVETFRKDISQSPEEIGQLLAQQQAQLHSYRWVDAKRKIASIPIDRAMELVVRDLADGRPPLPVFPKPEPTTTRATTTKAATSAATQTSKRVQ